MISSTAPSPTPIGSMPTDFTRSSPPRDSRDRAILGTAQLGTVYGIANRRGRPAESHLLSAAFAKGVRQVDTAQAYEGVEELLGRLFQEKGFDMRVTTKLDPDVVLSDAHAVRRAAQASVDRLGHAPDVLLLHIPDAALHMETRVETALAAILDANLAKALGVSVYSPHEFDAALDVPLLSVIQAPMNVLDRRLLDNDRLERATASGTRVQIRSVLLQGLLTMTADEVSARADFAKRDLNPWLELCENFAVDPTAAAIAWVACSAPHADLVLGCETAIELEANLKAIADFEIPAAFLEEVEGLSASSQTIDPRSWE